MIKSAPFKFRSDAEKFASSFPEDNFCIEQQPSGAWVVSVLLDDTEKLEVVKNDK